MITTLQISYNLSNIIIVKSWLDLIVKSGICVTITSLIFTLIYSRSEGFKIIIRKIK